MVASIVNSATATGGGTTLICNKPTNTANGDLLLAFHFNDYGTFSQMTGPSGWASVTGLDQGSNNIHFKSWSKTAASEGSSYTFGQGGLSDGCIIIVALRGVNVTAGTWIWATPVWTAAGTPRICPSVAGIQSGGILLCSSGVDMNDTAGTWTPPGDMSSQGAIQSSTWSTLCVTGLVGPSDPSGTKSFALSGSQYSTGGIEWSIGIQPTAVAPTGQFFALF